MRPDTIGPEDRSTEPARATGPRYLDSVWGARVVGIERTVAVLGNVADAIVACGLPGTVTVHCARAVAAVFWQGAIKAF